MKIGDRLKMLRKDLHLTQAEFAARIGLKQAVIGMYENGSRNIIDRNIAIICERFRVRREWLVNGEEPRDIKTDDSILDTLSKEFNMSESERRIVHTYLKLDPVRRSQLIDFVENFALEITKKHVSPNKPAATRPSSLDMVAEDKEIYIASSGKRV